MLLARANFGRGSSREHAPWGVKDYSFRVIIAPSYADIFYNNCFKNGILPATYGRSRSRSSSSRTEKEEGYSLTVNLPNQTIADKHGLMFKFEIAPSRKEVLVKALDDIGTSMQQPPPRAIARFSFTREAQGADSGADSENRGISLRQMVRDIATYLRGWLGCFGDCQTPSVLQDLETWLRRLLRSVVWKRGRTRFRELRKRGVSKDLAAKTAGTPHGPWRLANSPAVNIALPNAYSAEFELPPMVCAGLA